MIAKQRPAFRPAPPKPWEKRGAVLLALPARPPEPDRRQRIYAAIVDYAKAHGGHTPTIREIQRIESISSTSVVGFHVAALIRDGRLEVIDGKRVVVGGKWIAPDEEDTE